MNNLARPRQCIGRQAGTARVLSTLALLVAAFVPAAADPVPVHDRMLIDVRTEQEWRAGHIDGAVLIEHERIAERIASVAADPDTPIALYCRSGRRSGLAQEALRAIGYTDVINLGGLDDARRLLAGARECPAGQTC